MLILLVSLMAARMEEKSEKALGLCSKGHAPPPHAQDSIKHDVEQPCSRLSRTFKTIRMMVAIATKCVHEPVTVKMLIAGTISLEPPSNPKMLVLWRLQPFLQRRKLRNLLKVIQLVNVRAVI